MGNHLATAMREYEEKRNRIVRKNSFKYESDVCGMETKRSYQIWVNYIVIHRRISFVLSELISVARH